jgi:serine/threonine-protein kinase
MVDPQASRFWQAALQSDLMNAQSLNTCWNAIPLEKRDAPEHIDRRLARQAVHTKALTLWQAQQLLAGRTTGFRVDRYVLMDLIGQGGMGRVYLANDSRLNRRVALKILSPERVNNPRAIARFQREARVGAQLQHENLVRIYDFGESSGRYYLVMEYIEGKTIGTLISEGGQMPPAAAVRLVRQVALGLEHAHRKGLIHRDVNPYNILVTHDGIAKLTDMGLAINLAEEDRVTRDGATVGTFDYVAPEQARHSHAADIRSDIYSLGCTLYHMISCQVPFPTPSLPEKLFAHQAMEPTPLDKLVPGLAKGLAEVVSRMMRKSPDDRYASPALVAQALEPFETASNCSVDGKDLIRPSRQPALEASLQLPQLGDQLPQDAAQSPVILAGANAAPAGLQAGPAGRAGASKIGTSPAPVAVLTPVNDPAAVSDPDFPLLVDLGPEPTLSEGLSRPKSRFANVFSTTTGSSTTPQTPVSNPEPSTDTAWARPKWPLSVWQWALVALTVVLVLSLAFLGFLGVPEFNPEPRVSQPRPDLNVKHSQKSPVDSAHKTDLSKSGQTPESPFVVRLADDEAMPFENLLLAIQTAMANHGYVELRNREPYRLRNDQPLDFRQSVGSLDIRAAPGMAPIIESELKGQNSPVTTGSSVSLQMSGITIVVYYPETSAVPPPPIIKAARNARIDRCAFKVARSVRRRDSRAIVFEGDVLEVNRSWFEGFDEAIEVSLLNKDADARIQQTMIVPSPPLTAADSQSSEWHGWGVQARLLSERRSQTKTASPHLTFDHCTVEGAGMLDLASSTSPASLRVEVKHCAVKAEALLACKAGKPGETLATRVLWSGTGNQYDILGRDWIVLSPHQGTPASSMAVNDLSSWSKVAGESNPIQGKLRYQIAPPARSNPLKPHDFAIDHSGSPGNQTGANPDLVGPSSAP